MTSGVGGQPGMRRSTGRMRVDRADDLVCSAEHVAAERAVAERRDPPRLRHRVVGDEQRLTHAARHRAGDEEHVRMPR